MKKLFILFSSLILGMTSFAGGPGEIDEKVIQSFSTTFPNALEVNWFELSESYVVNFTESGIRSSTLYRKDGSFVRFTRYYFERHLPFHVLMKIKKEYPGKKIYGVTEISTITKRGETMVEYFVKLEDSRFWITLRIANDLTLTESEKFKKA